MANPTTNFGWVMPTSTDLVTDLPADFEVFGQAVDTAFVDLKGGTTGQILSKTSATDLDFTWVSANPGDITGVTAGTGISGGGTSGDVTITNSMATIIDAKGDLIGGTGADTFARLGVGANNTVLTADSAETTGMKWATPAAGGMTVLASGSLSGTDVTLSSINQTYNDLRLVVRDLRPQTAAQNFRIRFNGVESGYIDNSSGTNSNSSFGGGFVSGVGQDNGATTNSIIIFDAYDYTFSGTWKTGRMLGLMQAGSGGNTNFQNWAWGFNSTSAISSINMSMTSGDLTSGTYILYGVK